MVKKLIIGCMVSILILWWEPAFSLFIVQAKQRKSIIDVEKERKIENKKNFKSNKRHKKIDSKQREKKIDTYPFSLGFASAERIRFAIIEQAHIAYSTGLQKVGVAQGEADTITASVVSLIRKGYEVAEKLTQEFAVTLARKYELDKVVQKTVAQKQESIQLQEKIRELLEKKSNNEQSLGALASTLSISIAKIGLGTKSEEAIQQLLKKIKIPGVEYGVIASQVAAELWKGIANLKKDSYIGALKKYIKYYLGTSKESIGGWSFGQHLPTGKIYVRLDTACHSMSGHVHVAHRELVLKYTYPFREVSKQFGQIMAGDFELGEYVLNHMPRTFWVNIFG